MFKPVTKEMLYEILLDIDKQTDDINELLDQTLIIAKECVNLLDEMKVERIKTRPDLTDSP